MNRLPGLNGQLNSVDSSPLTPIHRGTRGTAARAFVRSKLWSKVTVALIVWLSCALVEVRPAGAQNVPTGTIELSGGSVAAGVGYTWGRGTLVFEGKKYPLKVNGISILHVGVSDYTASGTVYNLEKVSDIKEFTVLFPPAQRSPAVQV